MVLKEALLVPLLSVVLKGICLVPLLSLKEIDLLFVSSMVLKEALLVPLLSVVLKGICLVPLLSRVLKGTCLVPLLSVVLKEGALLTSCSMSWKETFFLPDLPMVLKEVSLPLFLTVSLTLLALSFSLVTLMPFTLKVLKGVGLYCSLLPLVSLAEVLKGVSVHVHIAMVLKELDDGLERA